MKSPGRSLHSDQMSSTAPTTATKQQRSMRASYSVAVAEPRNGATVAVGEAKLPLLDGP